MEFVHPITCKGVFNRYYILMPDSEILKRFLILTYCLMSKYRCVDNFLEVKRIVGFLRKSCVLTLAVKHRQNCNWVRKYYGLDPCVYNEDGNVVIQFPSTCYIQNLDRKFFKFGFFVWKLSFRYILYSINCL